MPKCWEPGLIFMQDNANIHIAHAVCNWFQAMAIPLVDWPPYFPDLNPIERVWYHLKKLVLQKYPDLEGMGKGEESIKALENALVDRWDVLPNSLFVEVGLNVMLSTKRKFKVEERGWGAAGYRSGTFIDNSHRWSSIMFEVIQSRGTCKHLR
jgi:hypothetical protein